MMPLDSMQCLLRQSISLHRYEHSLGVMDTAVSLARQFGADVEACRVAGLLHDCAKSLSDTQLLETVRRGHVELYDHEDEFPWLLHAPAGSVLAQEIYGVEDTRILTAIRRHTVGAPEMSLMDTIIFVSDFIEPGRKTFEGLDEVRLVAQRDLIHASAMCKEHTASYCRERNMPVFCF